MLRRRFLALFLLVATPWMAAQAADRTVTVKGAGANTKPFVSLVPIAQFGMQKPAGVKKGESIWLASAKGAIGRNSQPSKGGSPVTAKRRG